MAFYLGAMAGKIGEALQMDNERAARKLEKDEDRVALLTNTALDFGTQVYLDKKKDTDKTRKAIEQGMATLAGTGLSRAARFKIASGGSAAISNVLSQYNTAIENNRDVDFSTIYDVKNSDAFADMSDEDFFATVMPSVSPDLAMQTSRTFLERRKGMPGYENLDVDSVMSQFQTTAGLSDDTAVLETPPTLGELSVNFKGLRSAIGKEDKPKEFSSPTEAKTYYTGLILDEKENEGGGDATLIASYEGRVSAYDNLIDKKDAEDKPFDVEKRLKEIPGLIFALENSNEEGAAAKITNLKAERDGYLEHNKVVAASKDKGKNTPRETLDIAIDSVALQLSKAIMERRPQSEIEALRRKENILLDRKQATTAKTPEDKDPYTAPQAQTHIRNRIGQMFNGFDFVEVDTLNDKMTIKFGDGADKYPTFFQGMEGIYKGLVRDAEKRGSQNLKKEIPSFQDQFELHINTYIEKFKDKARYAGLNQEFATQEAAEEAANKGDIPVGKIIRVPNPNGGKSIAVWTGEAFR